MNMEIPKSTKQPTIEPFQFRVARALCSKAALQFMFEFVSKVNF